MTRRVLRRPRHGWAQTRGDRMLSLFDTSFWLCILCVWFAIVGISLTSSTIVMIKDVIDYYDGDLNLEEP